MDHSDKILIEEFIPFYQENVLNLIVNIQQKEFKISITAEDQPDLCNIKDFYQNGKGNFWVALINKKVIGTISLLDIGYEQVALRKMFVEKAYRGEVYQVARTLLNEVLKWSRLKGIKEIYLGTTPKFLAAHRFYKKNGFVKITEQSLPSAFTIMKVDTKFYKFEL